MDLRFPIRKRAFLVCLFLAITLQVASMVADGDEETFIRPYGDNPAYWQYRGEPVLLIGGNKWDAPFFLEDPGTFYEQLQQAGGNYVRYILKQRVTDSGGVVRLVKMFPYTNLENGLYDLNQWNSRYWNRFARGIEKCEELGIIVQITLWDRFDFYQEQWEISPWNPMNNVNYTVEESGLKRSYPTHPGRDTNPFLKTVPTMENNAVVLNHQEKLIGKMMSIALNHGNVLYNMGNEGNLGQRKWDLWWTRFIRDQAKEQGKTIHTTTMYGKQRWGSVVANPTDYTFVEGSKVGSRWTNRGQIQYETALRLIDQTNSKKKRPVNAVKVRTQKIAGHPQERLWRPLMAGFAAVSHHRTTPQSEHAGGPGTFDDNNTTDYPRGGLGFEEVARRNIQAMRAFTDALPPWETEPHQELLSDRETDEAYLRAQPGEIYGLYFPDTGSVGLNLESVKGTFSLRWIDIGRGGYMESEEEVNGGRTITLSTPYNGTGGWAAVLKNQD